MDNRRKHYCFCTDICFCKKESLDFLPSDCVNVERLEELTLVFDRHMPEGVTEYSWVCWWFVTDIECLADDISSLSGRQLQFTEVQKNMISRCNVPPQKSLSGSEPKWKRKNRFWQMRFRDLYCPLLQIAGVKQSIQHLPSRDLSLKTDCSQSVN